MSAGTTVRPAGTVNFEQLAGPVDRADLAPLDLASRHRRDTRGGHEHDVVGEIDIEHECADGVVVGHPLAVAAGHRHRADAFSERRERMCERVGQERAWHGDAAHSSWNRQTSMSGPSATSSQLPR